MPGNSLVFRSAEAEAACLEAYDAALEVWPVPYEQLEVPTRLGNTHVILSGPAGASPVVLLPGNFASATMWHSCVAELSRHHRTYAVDNARSAVTRARQLIPGIQAEIIPDAGHLLLQDQPHAISDRIVRFLGEPVGGPPPQPV